MVTLRVEKFKHRAIESVVYLYDIIRNRSWYTEYKRGARQFTLAFDFRQGIRVAEYLYNRIFIIAIHNAVGAFADHFASLYGKMTEGSADIQHFREARDFEDVIYFRRNVDDRDIVVRFFQTKQNAQTGTGNIRQFFCVDYNRLCAVEMFLNFVFNIRGVGCGDLAVQNNGKLTAVGFITDAAFIFLSSCHAFTSVSDI